jgi:hypothetical protein
MHLLINRPIYIYRSRTGLCLRCRGVAMTMGYDLMDVRTPYGGAGCARVWMNKPRSGGDLRPPCVAYAGMAWLRGPSVSSISNR